MAKFNASQFKSQMRSLENKMNSEIKREVRKAENQFKRDYNQAVNKMVRQYNSDVRRNRQRIQTELNKLSRTSTYSVSNQYRMSVNTLNNSYTTLNNAYNLDDEIELNNKLLNKAEEENANNLEVANVLFNNEETDNTEYSLEENLISDKLVTISKDLDDRWKGAIFALNPSNPDATRHFCTSAREIFINIIDTKAEDETVLKKFPDCEKTDRGAVSRRAKIKYFLSEKGILDEEIENFAHEDIENVLSLILEMSGGTHGNAGKFSINQLKSIKKRVESGLDFLCNYII